tara:strand:- start:1175 stop:1336 length:162 start_codon:yes stop_codon:yes gene_type:complete
MSGLSQLDKALIQRGRDQVKVEVLKILKRYEEWAHENEICDFQGAREEIEALP